MKINNRLQQALGYTFKDESLLVTALSHRSVGKNNNERLEFLGDSLLNCIIAEALFQKFLHAKEGDLSRLRASLVKGDTLADMARQFDLGEYLLLGEGELKSGGFRRASILADAVEAIIGAIYLDSDMETCRTVVLDWFDARLKKISLSNTEKDPKTRLQEYLQEKKLPLPTYTVIETSGQAHAMEFVVECKIDPLNETTQGKSSSKRNAEKLAAGMMLDKLSDA
ncbi:Ribonuclease 3 [Thalassocella blandensis]|nr:Ribonuclease 3 [Thalassocella blandensis]